jgi:thiol-disulfide isomerase/thioredoxin
MEQKKTPSYVENADVTVNKRPVSIQRKILLPLILFVVVAITGFWYITQSTPILAPLFSLTDLDGKTFTLTDFRGQIVVIDFMATWCGPCRLQMPHNKLVWEEFGDQIIVLSIDIDVRESEQTLKTFANDYPYATWIWARDTAKLSEAYKITAIPTTVIIDHEGYIRFTHVGVTSSATLFLEIEELMN